VLQGLPLCAVIEEALHQGRDFGVEGDPLVIASGLSQGMASVVALQVNGLAPALEQSVEIGNGHNQSLAFE
jgi:hypothetical protein